MNALLMTVMLWLSTNFGLPATSDHPHVEFVPQTKIVELRYNGLAGVQPNALPFDQKSRREPVAVYVHKSKTIYLREDWTGSTPGELSVLVHEMVHHLQNVGGLRFECPQEREQLAYKAQEKWLGLFGSDLLREFEVDSFTLLISSKCFY
jgi:hypothetical protein